MEIKFIDDMAGSGESNCEVHFLYKVKDKVSLSQPSAILDEGTDGLLSETLNNNKFKGKFLDSFFIRYKIIVGSIFLLLIISNACLDLLHLGL